MEQIPQPDEERMLNEASETVRKLQGRIAARDAFAPLRAEISAAVARARPETTVELPDTKESEL